MPRSSQVPPFTQGLRKQGEGATRAQRVTVIHHRVLSEGLWAVGMSPPAPAAWASPSGVWPLACVHLTYLTVPPGKAWGTVTFVFANVVEAGPSVVTGARGTRVWLPWKQKELLASGVVCPQLLLLPWVPNIPEPGAFTGTLPTSRHVVARSGVSGGPTPSPPG